MNVKQAKAERDKILTQKTVSVPRLKRVLDVLDYDKLQSQYINQGREIKAQRKENKRLRDKILNQKSTLRTLNRRGKK